MKENLADRVFDGVVERHGKVMERLHKEYKGTKPFRKESPKPEELRNALDTLTPEEQLMLVQKHGLPAYWQFITKLRQRG